MTPRFSAALARCLEQIPPGRVASCGQIARALGDVRASRAVATWIHEHRELQASHRVVRADGTPVIETGASLLRREGIRLRSGRCPKSRFVEEMRSHPLFRRLKDEQARLAETIVEEDKVGPVRTIGGVDAAYGNGKAYVVGVRCKVGSLAAVEIVEAVVRIDFPYVPTYLAYREFPAIRAALRRFRRPPDVLLVDGHGRLHPSLLGVACHAGVRLRLPTIGVAKTLLVGRPQTAHRTSEDAVPVEFAGRIRGYAWTPAGRETPLYVSVGHRVSLETALSIVRASTKQRMPEPLRLADELANKRKRSEKREKGAGHRSKKQDQ